MGKSLNVQKITSFVSNCKKALWNCTCKILHFALFLVTPGDFNSKSNRMVVLRRLCYTRYTRVTPAGVTHFTLFSLGQNLVSYIVTYTFYKKYIEYIEGEGDAVQESLWLSGVTVVFGGKYIE